MVKVFEVGTLVLMNQNVFKVQSYSGYLQYDIVQHPNGERFFKKVPAVELTEFMQIKK